MSIHLSGLIAAPFTPFNADQSLNLPMVQPLAELLIAQEVTGAFVCGTTGEGPSLTTAERMETAAAWVKAAGDRLKVIVHVGHNSIAESVQLARHAASIGAYATAAIAPSFFRPASLEALVETCRPIAAAAPNLPFYYYHIPSLTGVDLPMADFVPLALDLLPNFAGVKYTHENLMDFARATQAAGSRAQLMFGRDEILLAGLHFGATAAVGSTYNFAGSLFNGLIDAFRRGEHARAREAQLRAISFIAAFLPFGGVAPQKAMMRMLGYDCGPVRAPLQNLTASQATALRANLERADFFKYATPVSKITFPTSSRS